MGCYTLFTITMNFEGYKDEITKEEVFTKLQDNKLSDVFGYPFENLEKFRETFKGDEVIDRFLTGTWQVKDYTEPYEVEKSLTYISDTLDIQVMYMANIEFRGYGFCTSIIQSKTFRYGTEMLLCDDCYFIKNPSGNLNSFYKKIYCIKHIEDN